MSNEREIYKQNKRQLITNPNSSIAGIVTGQIKTKPIKPKAHKGAK